MKFSLSALMSLVRRERLCYSKAEQKRIREYVERMLLRRYAKNSLVKNIWLQGSVVDGKIGAYKEPFTDKYGIVQEGSDIDVIMTLNYDDPIEKLRKDRKLHKQLLIRNKGGLDSYAFLNTSGGNDLTIKGRHPKTGKIVKHPVYGVIVTVKYFEELLQGLHDEEVVAHGGGPWKGGDPDKNGVRLK